VAEWLCSGLQIRVRRFDSDLSLHNLKVKLIKTILRDIKGLFSNRNFLQENLDYEIYWQNKGNIKQLKANSYHIKRAKFVSLVAEPNSSLLDLGSGDGAQLKEIEKICHIEMTASDFSDATLSRLREIGFSTKKINLKQEFSIDDSYDYISFFEVLEHLPNSEEILLEAYKNCNKGIFFSFPNTGYYIFRIELLFGKFPKQWRTHPSEHLRFWTRSDLRLWLKNLNLYEKSEVYSYEGIPILNKILPNLFSRGLFVFIKK
tara:strand:- start:920 stop:1699 length:780 start_codon:yes stop_codon:yes gene_type:complete